MKGYTIKNKDGKTIPSIFMPFARPAPPKTQASLQLAEGLFLKKNNAKNRRWYSRNKKQEQKRKLKYYYQYQEKHKINAREKRKENLKSWEDYLPLETNCQICNKKIYFNKGNVNQAINFDHRHNNIKIKVCPTAWLANHRRILKGGDLKNQKIWKNCNFGFLCGRCNTFLPTYGRKTFLKNAIKYVFGKNFLIKKGGAK